ncbi:MAG TPA: YDG domain-containing protein, partial [Rhodocyclaceae bacterium]|nr:YDG domain-containing protein [Rhodocyclaceae bacterium]
GAVTGSYWNMDTTGQGVSAGGTGLTTIQMKDRTNFSGWDFVNTWRQYDGHTYPLLKVFLKPLTVTANQVVKTYDGTGYSGGNGVTLSDPAAAGSLFGTLTFSGTAQGARNAGSYVITPAGYWSDQQGYDITFANGTLTVNKASLSVTGVTAADKVYDGNTAAVLTGGSILPFAGDSVTLSLGTGEFSDRHVGSGKTVTASGYILSGPDAGNYTLTQPSGLTANIGQRPSVAWIGTTGEWSNPANWQDGALPDRNNVFAVNIPSGATVIYDAATGNTRLGNLVSGGDFLLTGGNLDIAGGFQTVRFGQSGGSLTGIGNLTVNEAFSQTGGSIALADTAAVNITQVSGDLVARSINAGSVSLRAQDGAILDGGAGTTVTAHSLTLAATQGIGRVAAPLKTAVGWVTANNGEGDIAIVNNGALTVAGISITGTGDIIVDNIGALVTTGPVTAASGSVSLITHSPLTVGADGVSASGDIRLTASPSGDGANDILTINGPIKSGSQAILGAGNEIVINAEVVGTTGVTVDLGQVSPRSTVHLPGQGVPDPKAEAPLLDSVIASALSVFKLVQVQDTSAVQSQAPLLTIEPDVPGSQSGTSEYRSNKTKDVAERQE